MGEGWDEGDTPHLNPLPQGERRPFSSAGGVSENNPFALRLSKGERDHNRSW